MSLKLFTSLISRNNIYYYLKILFLFTVRVPSALDSALCISWPCLLIIISYGTYGFFIQHRVDIEGNLTVKPQNEWKTQGKSYQKVQFTLCYRVDFKFEASLPVKEKAHKTVKPASTEHR